MKIISFDIGIRNLAFCELEIKENKEFQIISWKCLAIPTHTKNSMFQELGRILRAQNFDSPDAALVERQPTRTKKKLLGVQTFIQGYFEGLNCPAVHEVSPTLKVDSDRGSHSAAYRKRKLAAVTKARNLIVEAGSQEWVDHFDSFPAKKDDLADSFLQAIEWFNGAETITPKVTKKTVRARRPTPSQREKRYSEANIKWKFENEELEKLKKEKRFLKDLKFYFSSWEEMEKEFSFKGSNL